MPTYLSSRVDLSVIFTPLPFRMGTFYCFSALIPGFLLDSDFSSTQWLSCFGWGQVKTLISPSLALILGSPTYHRSSESCSLHRECRVGPGETDVSDEHIWGCISFCRQTTEEVLQKCGRNLFLRAPVHLGRDCSASGNSLPLQQGWDVYMLMKCSFLEKEAQESSASSQQQVLIFSMLCLLPRCRQLCGRRMYSEQEQLEFPAYSAPEALGSSFLLHKMGTLPSVRVCVCVCVWVCVIVVMIIVTSCQGLF